MTAQAKKIGNKIKDSIFEKCLVNNFKLLLSVMPSLPTIIPILTTSIQSSTLTAFTGSTYTRTATETPIITTTTTPIITATRPQETSSSTLVRIESRSEYVDIPTTLSRL